jgi:hypothetical protein
MVGGVLEYAALITGYRVLLALVFVLYLLAFLTRPRRGEEAPAVEQVSLEAEAT